MTATTGERTSPGQTVAGRSAAGGWQIFVPGRGQYDNIGDIILRRQLLDWVRPLGTVHTYLGTAPDGYTRGLRLGPDDVVYSSFADWYRAGLRAAAAGHGAYFFKPGEIQMTMLGLKEHLSMLPLLVTLRLRGGRVARIGSGSRDFAKLPRLLMMPSVRIAQLTAWRDQKTASFVGHGSVMPDLAYAEGEDSFDDAGDVVTVRDTLVVSLRGDRPAPSEAWCDGVVTFAAERSLSIVVVTQVFRDRDRSRELAARLGGELLDWDGTDHDVQEDRLRAVFRRTALVLSDRLHVIIAAFTEGAAPSAAVGAGSAKIERHFEAAGMAGVTVDVSALDARGVTTVLGSALDRRAELLSGLQRARDELAEVRGQVAALLRRTGRPGPELTPKG